MDRLELAGKRWVSNRALLGRQTSIDIFNIPKPINSPMMSRQEVYNSILRGEKIDSKRVFNEQGVIYSPLGQKRIVPMNKGLKDKIRSTLIAQRKASEKNVTVIGKKDKNLSPKKAKDEKKQISINLEKIREESGIPSVKISPHKQRPQQLSPLGLINMPETDPSSAPVTQQEDTKRTFTTKKSSAVPRQAFLSRIVETAPLRRKLSRNNNN